MSTSHFRLPGAALCNPCMSCRWMPDWVAIEGAGLCGMGHCRAPLPDGLPVALARVKIEVRDGCCYVGHIPVSACSAWDPRI